jgi:hypothetical protein
MPSLVPFQPALRALDLLLGYHDPWLPVDRLRGDERRRNWHRCGDGTALVTLVSRADELWSDELHLGLSERRRGGQPCGATALWARIEGPKELQRAHGRGIKPKDLLGIPWMVAFALRADGWYLRSDIIWAKPNPMPESVTDRPTKAHEYVFLLSKGPRYFYDADAIREDEHRAGDYPAATTAAAS